MINDKSKMKEMVDNLKLQALSKMHLSPKQKYGFIVLASSFEQPINYVASALAALEKEGKVMIEQVDHQTIISLTTSEMTAEATIDPAVKKITNEIKALNKREEEERLLSRRQKTKAKTTRGDKSRRKLVVVTPEGERIETRNLSSFCKTNGLRVSSMYKVSYGELLTHKGYKIEFASTEN